MVRQETLRRLRLVQAQIRALQKQEACLAEEVRHSLEAMSPVEPGRLDVDITSHQTGCAWTTQLKVVQRPH
jgi:hypothetical protein